MSENFADHFPEITDSPASAATGPKRSLPGRAVEAFGRVFGIPELVRRGKQMDGAPLTTADIPRVSLHPFSAEREKSGLWQVYKVTDSGFSSAQDCTGRYFEVKKPVGTPQGLSPTLDFIAAAAPDKMAEGTDRMTHPAYVARVAGHQFRPG